MENPLMTEIREPPAKPLALGYATLTEALAVAIIAKFTFFRFNEI
jgi:hypothetical protein